MTELDEDEIERLASSCEALANPTRVKLLQFLQRPQFMADIVEAFPITRQALSRHLSDMEAVGLVATSTARRNGLPATQFVASPSGLFDFKEAVRVLAIDPDPDDPLLMATQYGTAPDADGVASGPGLLLIHGDVQGRWFPLDADNEASTWVIGRDSRVEVSLDYDGFASSRHALLRRDAKGWTLADLHSTNGTRVNFRLLNSREPERVRHGDVITVGRSHLLLREGPKR